ncbi:GNAT family N-acetyltransferase [Halobaculum lipolyticum]|uniref:GNAT family N-acetyltransferase n=1 Tax=Halobaculum lipolyticum TaxID=3032001 RepID=A0ABD5WH01_9EURY|nr:GNAT family N-acetyltransferase [Halobaculum sp. DT31]
MSDGDGRDGDDDLRIRVARDSEADVIRHLLDAAMLTVPADLADRVAAGDALVAVDGGDGDDHGGDGDDHGGDGDVVGALVLDGSHVESIAVRTSRRAEGVGRALVATAAERTAAPLTATFRRQVRPFYEALGFEVTPCGDDHGRFRGRLTD